ncbi:MAG: hypothetical protein QNL04_11135 [SAR324 cluster bacterium]|nr:hypothetical protein [SAR324 cluster bacterium]
MMLSPQNDLIQILKKSLFLVLISLLWVSSAFAQRSLELTKGNDGVLRLYHSYKSHLLTLSTQKKPTETSACEQNQYLFYDYKKDSVFEVTGASMMITRDYKYAIVAEIVVIKAVEKSKLKEFTKSLKAIASELKASSTLLEKTAINKADGKAMCWQRLTVVDLATFSTKKYPIILANLCPVGNCSEIQIEKNGKVKLWANVEPNQMHQIIFDPKSGGYSFGAKKKEHSIKPRIFDNAFRENLLKKPSGSLKLSSARRNKSSVTWKKIGRSPVVKLLRTGVDVRRAQELSKKVAQLNKEKEYKRASNLASFALWLDPDSVGAGYEKLKAQGLMGDLKGFFQKLRKDFNYKARVQTCRKLHLDADLQPLWKKQAFIKSFKEVCP